MSFPLMNFCVSSTQLNADISTECPSAERVNISPQRRLLITTFTSRRAKGVCQAGGHPSRSTQDSLLAPSNVRTLHRMAAILLNYRYAAVPDLFGVDAAKLRCLCTSSATPLKRRPANQRAAPPTAPLEPIRCESAPDHV